MRRSRTSYSALLMSKFLRPMLSDACLPDRISQCFFRRLADESESLHAVNRINYVRGDRLESSVPDFRDSDITLVGGSDQTFDSRSFEKLPGRFYVQNLASPESPKIKLLPIGLEDLSKASASVPHWGPIRSNKAVNRSDDVLIGPFGPTNPIRREVIQTFRAIKGPWKVLERRLHPFKLASEIRQHRFVLCPPGNGLDTHRYWEVLYWGSIPIVQASQFSSNLERLGLPHFSVERFTSDEIERVLNEAPRELEVVHNFLDVNWWRSELGLGSLSDG